MEEEYAPFKSPVEYRDWSRTLDRIWLTHLTPMQFCMVRFIFDRTAGWQKEWECITIRHFTDGVVGRDGKVHGKLNSARVATVSQNLAVLVEIGVILRRPRGNQRFDYAINYEWNPDMKVPKRLQHLAEKPESEENCSGRRNGDCSGRRNTTVPVGVTKEEGKETPSEREHCASLTAHADVEVGDEREELLALVERTASASRSRRASHKLDGYNCRGAAGGLVPSEGAMRRIWTDLHNAHFPESPVCALSVKAVHSLRGYAKEWNLRNPSKEFASDYLPWMFANWEGVRAINLHWFVGFPERPEPFMLANAKMRPHLETAWADQERLAAARAMTPREREILEIMRVSGVARKTAEGMAKNREDGAAELKRAKETLANAKMVEEQTRRENQVARAAARKAAAAANPTPLNLSAAECAAFEEAEEQRNKDKLRASVAAALAARPQRDTVQPSEPIPERFPDWE